MSGNIVPVTFTNCCSIYTFTCLHIYQIINSYIPRIDVCILYAIVRVVLFLLKRLSICYKYDIMFREMFERRGKVFLTKLHVVHSKLNFIFNPVNPWILTTTRLAQQLVHFLRIYPNISKSIQFEHSSVDFIRSKTIDLKYFAIRIILFFKIFQAIRTKKKANLEHAQLICLV